MQLIVNDQNTNFYNHLITLLKECDSFIFNVAFVNYSGVQLLLDIFDELDKKDIKGKILTSTYLNFTEVKALEKLKEFKNIELKIFTDEKIGFHAKAYIFEFKEEYKILLGSSNITASAFKSNIEWNIKSVSKKDEVFLTDILGEFKKLWLKSIDVSEEFLKEYKSFKDSMIKPNFSYKKIEPNFMQKEALDRLEFLRSKGENKALAIAATGSGKTYLAGFEVKSFKAKRMLFIVHRENILLNAKKSFENIMPNIKMGIFSGNKKEIDCTYLFSTIQSLSSNLELFKKDEFDYIIIDEAHHITSESYKKVYEYFTPKFLLGLTATPNRTDKESVYGFFDENIACDIRLNDALDEKLIVPFHYYGINDIKDIDYSDMDISKVDEIAKLLMVNKRVDFIIEQMNFYDFSGDKRRVLGFCSNKNHALYMSEEFNKRGINSISLTSEDSVNKREHIIKRLEDKDDELQVIFSVDIFNEGVDIPAINTVLMLRPTNSPIVFIQQLGRGLRHHKNKEFLTLLDFIGNHNKTYLIALALLGDKIIDKDSVKLSLLNNFANIPNAFISLDEISRQRILEQIDKQNFNSFKYLKDEYMEFKKILGKTPKLVDFISYSDFINPLKFINESKSYIEFIIKAEKIEFDKNEEFFKGIRFIEYLLPIKRVYEFVVLKYLLENSSCDIKQASMLLQKYLENVDIDTIKHCFRYLAFKFYDKAQISRYLKLVELKGDILSRSEEFDILLQDKKYKEIFEDSINYGILRYEEEFGIKDYGLPFLKLYEKYNMLNIAQLCNFEKIHSSFRGSGFLKYKDDFFLFITIEKDNYFKAQNYNNAFLSRDTFTYSSKPSHSSDKGDGYRLVNNQKEGVKLHIFVRKFAQVDKKTQSFIYLGLANTLKYENEKPIDTILKLQKPLSNTLYEEFTKIVEIKEIDNDK